MTVTIPDAAVAQLRRRWVPGPDWSQDPVGWMKERGKVSSWSKQREILEAVRDYTQTAVKSCHSAGKSFIAAEAAMWWIDSHPAGEAFVVTSAPTGNQVKAILWKEMNRAHKRIYAPSESDHGKAYQHRGAARLGGRMNQVEWYDVNDELVAFGRKPSDYEPTAFQGIHARYVLVILDEACGIPESLWDAASSLTSNEHGRILAIGNPDDPQSHFAKVCESDTWHVIRISAYDTPNFTDEEVDDSLRELLVSKRWVEEKEVEWGTNSGVFTSKVLGLFPTDAEDGVIPHSWAAACRFVEHVPSDGVQLGFDPARGGTDHAILWARRGPVALRSWDWPHTPDPLALAKLVLDVILEVRAESIKIDADGLGWAISGIFDSWHEDGLHNCIAVPVLGSAPAGDEEHFLNTRAEVWWNGRELSRLKEWDLRGIDDDTLNDLTIPKWHTNNPRQRVQIEKKSDIVKRLGRSPDSGDALLLAFWEPAWEAEDWTQEVMDARLPIG
jgi:hypothetical protein